MNMGNAKIYKILGAIAIVILFLFCIYQVLKSNSNQPAQSSKSEEKEDMISIPAQNGTVQTRDFTKNPVLQVENTAVIAKADNFDITYYAKDQSFLITLEAQPVRQARTAAEDAFLSTLDISQSDACKLKVSLTIPYDVDQNLSGKDYGLSFCPNGIKF